MEASRGSRGCSGSRGGRNILNRAVLREDIESHIEDLDNRLEQLNQEIKELTQANQQWLEKVNLLKTVPGIGQVISTTLVCE